MIRFGALPLAISLLLVPTAFAEVFVQTDSHGEFVSFTVVPRTDGSLLLHWQATSKLPNRDYLNLSGDAFGDHAPVAVVIPAGQLFAHPTPVVVWSRVDGFDNDVSFSYWQAGPGWSAPMVLNQPNMVPDVDVQIALDPHGDVHLLWATETETPSIFYSKFTANSWSFPERVSGNDINARSPSFTQIGSMLFVAYENWTAQPIVISSFLKEDFDFSLKQRRYPLRPARE